MIFRTLALTLPTTAVLDKISKQLVLQGREKKKKKGEWNQAEPSFLTAQGAVLAHVTPGPVAGPVAPTTDNILFNRQDYL